MMVRALGLAVALALCLPARAATFPTAPGVSFQTSGCQRGAGVGDWYTSPATASTTHYGDFFLEVTPAMAPATVTILDAESHGALDEILDADDPTRFELRSGDGSVLIAAQTVASGSADGTTVTFPSLAEGVYRIRSYTGSDEVPELDTGAYCDQAAGDNNDDNGFQVEVNGAASIDGLLGFLRTTYQQSTGAAADYPMYFLVGPDASDTTLGLRNFDLDGGASGTSYTRPGGGTVAGTLSGNATWNGAGATLDAGQDSLVADTDLAGGAVEAGAWGFRIEGWSSGNQTLFEARAGGNVLALTDAMPTRAGFFALTPSATLATSPGVAVDHPFSVANQFFASDLVQLSLSGTAAGFTAALRSDPDCDGDSADGAALADSDGDGAVDTGLLAIFGTAGATKCFALRVTPDVSASGADTTTISAVSLLDQRVGAANTTRTIGKTTTLVPPSVAIVAAAAVVSDPLHGTSSPRRIPGAVLEYTLTIANPPAGRDADTLVVTDAIPAGTAYVPGSLKVGGVAEDDDAAGADETDPDGGDVGVTGANTVTARIAALAAGASTTVVFRVTIN